MPRPRPPHLLRERTRHGRFIWIVRKGHGPRIRLRAEYGTEAFWAQYRAALEGTAPEQQRARSGSLQWLYERYRETSAWTEKSPATRRQREHILAGVMRISGHEPC